MSWRNHRFFFKNPISYSCFAIHGWKRKHQLKNKKQPILNFPVAHKQTPEGRMVLNYLSPPSQQLNKWQHTQWENSFWKTQKFHRLRGKESERKRWWRIGRDIWTMPRIGLFPEPHVLSRKEIVSVMIWVCRQPLPFQKMFFSKLAFSNFQAFNWTLEASKLPLIYWRKLARPNNAQLEVELFNINEENITSKATVWPYVEIRKN